MTRTVRYELEARYHRPAQIARPAPTDPSVDREMLSILDDGLSSGETIEQGYRRKEQLLGELFARLPLATARALHRRLASPSRDDAAAQRFQRLIAARRERLLAFLADAPRRAALAHGRHKTEELP